MILVEGSEARDAVEEMLDALGYEIVETRDDELWSIAVRVTADVLVGVAPDGDRDGLQIDMTVDVDPADLEALQASGGAAFTAQVKDLLLADHLEYDMQMDGEAPRRVQVIEHLQRDALTFDALERCVRRVKDAYYRIAVALDRAVDSRGSAERRKPRASSASVTSLPLEPATLAALEDALSPGQTFDELLHELLARKR